MEKTPEDPKITQEPLLLELTPLTSRRPVSPRLQQHISEMTSIVEKLLATKQLASYSAPNFFRELEHALPIVQTELVGGPPGEIALYLFAKNVKHYDLAQFFTEMIQRWLLPWNQAKIVSTKQLSFSFGDATKKTFFVSEVLCQVVDEAALYSIKDKLSSFSQEVKLGAMSAHHARHILATKGLTQEQKTTELHKTIIELSNGRCKSLAADLFFELHSFLLASDDEFRRIRPVRHMCRLICYHNWFRRQLRTLFRQHERQIRFIKFKLSKSLLQFAFGEKRVLGLLLSVSYLSEYEQFEAKHILKACQRIISNIRLVPASFYHYVTNADPTHSFYLEIEKKDGKDFTLEEIKQLQVGLKAGLPLGIEQLSHKLFMPHNEEEVLRNILLLAQELRTPKDPPQIIANFRGQSENTLTFHVILVRLVKENSAAVPCQQLLENTNDFLTFVLGAKKIAGTLKSGEEKEANTFLLECPKAPFLRQDHSVDLLRAREFVVSSLKKVFPTIRDFNGGLIGQQNQLLAGLKEFLGPGEHKHELHLENLFHSMSPVLMKSLLAPELIRSLFGLFVQLLENSSQESQELAYKEMRLEHALLFMISTDEKATFDDLAKTIDTLGLKELELATSSFKVGSLYYQGYIFVPENPDVMDRFSSVIHERLNLFSRSKNLGQTLRISLPRPTSLLDPRIGTDRTSGIVIKMLYEGLMRIDSTGKPSPAVAERVEVSPDLKSYTFYLRRTKWSNGKPVTAYDFEYAWKKILDPHFKSLYTYLFYVIKNARGAKKGSKTLDEVGIYVKDAYTLRIELEHPASYFLELCCHWAFSPLCKEIDELHPGWAYYGGEHFICNGPFRLANWKRNSEIQVVKNQEYWDAEFVHLRRIDISIIENPNLALELYQKGELDWIGEPLSEIPPATFKQKNFTEKIFTHPLAAIHWYNCNVKVAPFTSKKCRLAMAMALNRQAIIDELLHGDQAPAFSILPPTLTLQKMPPFHDSDPKMAKELFLEGLAEQKLTLETLPPITITSFDMQLHEALAHKLAEQWHEALGIDVTCESCPWDRAMAKCTQYDFHIMSMTWYSWFNDPLYNLDLLKYAGSDLNMTQWQNDQYMSLLDHASACSDPKERKSLLAKAEMLAMEEMPIIPLFYYTFKYMKKEHVNNIFLSDLGQIDFKWAYINKK
jgi:oligopeptide transport system substrate-binding protein